MSTSTMRSFRLLQASKLVRQSRPSAIPRRTPSYSSPLSNNLFLSSTRQPLRNLFPRRRPFSSKSDYNPTKDLGSPAPSSTTSSASLSISQRFRKLTREYGWSAFGVYMALSVLDFPFCFLAVRLLGTERIGAWEHAILQWVKRAVPVQWPEKYGGPPKVVAEVTLEEPGSVSGGDNAVIMAQDHGVREADEENSGEKASIWTQLALAYAIHKSFIFLRVPLTAAITPRVVHTLRGWGYNIGKRTPKAERLARKAEIAEQKAARIR